MRHPELPVSAAFAAVVILIPLPAQVRVRNVALQVLIVGTSFVNIISLVNTVVWAGNVRDIAPVWCDICWLFLYPHLNQSLNSCPFVQRRTSRAFTVFPQ